MASEIKRDAVLFARPVPSRELGAIRRPKSLTGEASEAERASIARALGLERLDLLRYEATLAPDEAADWRLDGRIAARLAQPCSVTGAPVPEKIDALFARRWSADAVVDPAEIDIEFAVGAADLSGDGETALDDFEVEPTPDPIDPAAVALETLILSLDPYPRAPGAAFEGLTVGPPGAAPLDDAAARPFSGLAALREKDESVEPSQTETPPDAEGPEPSRSTKK